MTEKKFWRIDQYWETSYQKCDGTFVDDVESSSILIDLVEATEEEIKNLFEADWNPVCMENEYGDKFRRYEACEIVPETINIDDLKKILKERCEEYVG